MQIHYSSDGPDYVVSETAFPRRAIMEISYRDMVTIDLDRWSTSGLYMSVLPVVSVAADSIFKNTIH